MVVAGAKRRLAALALASGAKPWLAALARATGGASRPGCGSSAR